MDLLFRRSQSVNSAFPVFKLHAIAEFTDEEYALINKYKLKNSILIEMVQPGLLRTAILTGLFAFFLLYVLFTFGLLNMLGLHLGWVSRLALAGISSMMIGYFYYHQKRETIYVKDLIHGRYFKCRSVCALVRTEAYLETIAGYFRQVVESSKHWDGQESIQILPLPKQEARAAILKGPLL